MNVSCSRKNGKLRKKVNLKNMKDSKLTDFRLKNMGDPDSLVSLIRQIAKICER